MLNNVIQPLDLATGQSAATLVPSSPLVARPKLRPALDWTERSDDLASAKPQWTAGDYWLWGHLKHIIYQTEPQNVGDL